MATSYDLNIVRGSSVSIRLNAKNDDGVPYNLSGFAVSGHVRHKYSDTGVLLNLSPTVVNNFEASGYIDIEVPASATTGLPIVQGIYDVEIYSGTFTEKLIEGYANIHPEVTR